MCQVWTVTRSQGRSIPSGGTLVIGREQDCQGGCFDSMAGAFLSMWLPLKQLDRSLSQPCASPTLSLLVQAHPCSLVCDHLSLSLQDGSLYPMDTNYLSYSGLNESTDQGRTRGSKHIAFPCWLSQTRLLCWTRTLWTCLPLPARNNAAASHVHLPNDSTTLVTLLLWPDEW